MEIKVFKVLHIIFSTFSIFITFDKIILSAYISDNFFLLEILLADVKQTYEITQRKIPTCTI